MTEKIKAIGAYRPRIVLGNTVQKAELMRAVVRTTGLVEASADQAIKEFRDQIIEIVRSGRAVKIEGLGTWTPNLLLDGSLDIQYRPDTALVNGLNMPGMFTGKIMNREHIGKTSQELVELWNAQHPEDPVE